MHENLLCDVTCLVGLVFDGDQEKDFIRGLGLVFTVPMREQVHNRHVRFSGEAEGVWSEPLQPATGRRALVLAGRGNIYAAAGLHRRRGTHETLDTKCGVHVISPQGKLLKFIPIPEDFITNNAFGGPDMKTLYVTAGKTLYKVRTDIAGLPR